MKLAYVRWIDACYQDGEHDLSTLGEPVILESYGVLVKETADAVVLSVELPREGRARNPFSIPRRNVLEMRTRKLDSIFRRKS